MNLEHDLDSKSQEALQRIVKPPRAPQRHPTFYFTDELSIFQVEDTLFKVHRHFLVRDSETFATVFSSPQDLAGTKQGESEEHPIVLSGVLKREFVSLLKFFYDGMYSSLGANSISTARALPNAGSNTAKKPKNLKSSTLESSVPTREVAEHPLQDLFDLLSISTRFDFVRAREYAIAAIDESPNPIDPIQKIVLAQLYEIPQWLSPAYVAVCQRVNALTVEEAMKIGIQTAIRLAQARETVKVNQRSSSFDPVAAKAVVDTVMFPTKTTVDIN